MKVTVTGPAGLALSGSPLQPQGLPKIDSNRFAKTIFGTHPERRSPCRPSRPDSKGQARGEAQEAGGKLCSTQPGRSMLLPDGYPRLPSTDA
jgi:hypothetical protein